MKNFPDDGREFGHSFQEPLVLNTMGPYRGKKGEPIYFNASCSGGSKPLHFFWEFGDGGSAAGQSVHYTYAASGTFVVTLKVTDGHRKSKRVYTSATVENAAVSVDLGPERTVTAGEPVVFRAGITGGGTPEIYSYRWDFGDESPVRDGSGKNSHIYAFPGKYKVTVEVSDGEGLVGRSTVPVTVIEQQMAAPDERPARIEPEAQNLSQSEVNLVIPSAVQNQDDFGKDWPELSKQAGLSGGIAGKSGDMKLIPLSDRLYTVIPGDYRIITLGGKEANPPEGKAAPTEPVPMKESFPSEKPDALKESVPSEKPDELKESFPSEKPDALKESVPLEEPILPEEPAPVMPEQIKTVSSRQFKSAYYVKVRGPV